MPQRAGANCKRPGCPGIVRDGKCSVCGPRKQSNWRSSNSPSAVLSASARGYGATWRKLRAMKLADTPLCEECERQGRLTGAITVDHIIPKTLGGTDAWENLQSLCDDCHKFKTSHESKARPGLLPATVPVVVVAGPPGSGKTTYVETRKQWGDLVVDVDALYIALSGGLPWYEKPIGLLPFVCEARDAVIARLSRSSEIRRAWIITGETNRDKVESMVASMNAQLVVMETSEMECLRRIAMDERRKDKAELWRPLVSDWFRQWERR